MKGFLSLRRKVPLHFCSKASIIRVNSAPPGSFVLFKTRHDLEGVLRRSSRGSPMVIGVKCADQLAANHIPVMFSKGKSVSDRRDGPFTT